MLDHHLPPRRRRRRLHLHPVLQSATFFEDPEAKTPVRSHLLTDHQSGISTYACLRYTMVPMAPDACTSRGSPRSNE